MNKGKLVYYTDTLCGWCYGFSPVIGKIYQTYQHRVDFEVVSGGLFLGHKVGPINEVAPYIKAGAYKKVEQATGVKFGEDFLRKGLEEGAMVLNSLPPSIAISVVKDKRPEKTLEFTELLLKAFYFDGMNPEDLSGYGKYAAEIGFSVDEFNVLFAQPIYKEKAEQDFQLFRGQQLSGFPSVVLETDREKTLLVGGSASYDNLKNRLDQLLEPLA